MKNNLIICLLAFCGIAKTNAMLNVRLMSGRVVHAEEMLFSQAIDRAHVEHAVIADHVAEKLKEGVRVDPDILSCKFVRSDGTTIDPVSNELIPEVIAAEPQDESLLVLLSEDVVKKALKTLRISPERPYHDSLILTIKSHPEISMTFTIIPEDNLDTRENFLEKQWQMESSWITIYNYRVWEHDEPRPDEFNATLMLGCETVISEAHDAREDHDLMARLVDFIANASFYQGDMLNGTAIKIGNNLALQIATPKGTEKLTKGNFLDHFRQIEQIYVEGQNEQIPMSLEILIGNEFKKEPIPEEQKQQTMMGILISIISMAQKLDELHFETE